MTYRILLLTSVACFIATACSADSLPRSRTALAVMPPSQRPALELAAAQAPTPAMPGRRVVPYRADPWQAPAAPVTPAPSPTPEPLTAPAPTTTTTTTSPLPRTSGGAVSLYPHGRAAADGPPAGTPAPAAPSPIVTPSAETKPAADIHPTHTTTPEPPAKEASPPPAKEASPPPAKEASPPPAKKASSPLAKEASSTPEPPPPPPPPPEPPQPIWHVSKGETYRDIMNRAAREAGWNDPIFDLADPDDDWEIQVTPPPFQGSFEAFVGWLTKGVSHKLPRPVPTLSKSAKSVLIREVN